MCEFQWFIYFLSTLYVLWGLVLDGVDVESGVKSCTGEAFKLRGLNLFSLDRELRSCEEALE